MTNLFLLILGLLSCMPVFLCELTTEEDLTVLEGRSLLIPCHYEPQFRGYVKYWCRGRTREFCTTLAQTDDLLPTDSATDKVSISDDPVHQVFTVTMNDLKEGDTGWYMCGVMIGGAWSADDRAFTYIKVVHGMSVVNSRVSGEEGSSVTVECLYSERYREIEKKWCRSGDWNSGQQTGSDGSYEDTSVAISDDRTGAYTVTLKKLQINDSGWYWCSAGQQKISVHVLVKPQLTSAVSVTSSATPSQSVEHLPPQKSITNCWHYRSPVWVSMAVCSTLLLLLCVALLVRKLWKLHTKGPLPRKANVMTTHNHYSADVPDMESTAIIILKKDSPDLCMY